MTNSLVVEKTAATLAQKYGNIEDVYKSKSNSFYVINTTKKREDMRVTRGRICVPVLSENGRSETMINIANTFVPINLAETVTAKEIRANSAIRTLINRGFLTPIPDSIAIQILNSSAGINESNRMNEIEDNLIRSQVEATKAGDHDSVTEAEVIVRNDINEDMDDVEVVDIPEMAGMEIPNTNGATLTKDTKVKKSKTSQKIAQIIKSLNEDKNEEEAIKTLSGLKLRERHWAQLLHNVDSRMRKVRKLAASEMLKFM